MQFNHTKYSFCMVEYMNFSPGGENMRYSKIKILPQNIIFTVSSLLLAFFVRIPLIPALPFIKLDISDTPILIATLLSGPVSGCYILFVVSFLRFLLFSSAGFIGFITRMTSAIIVLSISFIKKNNINIFIKILILLLGIIFCLLVKIPINYFSWIYFFGVPKNVVCDLMLSYIVPFNLFKSTLNCVLALMLTKSCKNMLNKISKTF